MSTPDPASYSGHHGQDRSHGADHRHDHPGEHHHHSQGLRGWLTNLVKPHSHDAADSVDTALEASAQGVRAVKLSLVGLAATALLQLVLVLITGSVALFADTVHNFSDALTAVPLWVAFVLGRRPPSRRFTYGFGRAEDLAGVFIVVMIVLSALVAGWESIRRLLDPVPLEHAWMVVGAGVIGFIGNELVANYRIRVGRRIGSAALVADGLHARTDGFTSLAVVLGALGVMAGFPIADPLIGLLITVAILVVLKGAVVEVYRRLMDAVDPALVDAAEGALRDVPGVRDVGRLRIRWIGHRLTAEADITVDRDLTVVEGHAIAVEAEHRLLHGVPRLTGATLHVNPTSAGQQHPHELLAHHRT